MFERLPQNAILNVLSKLDTPNKCALAMANKNCRMWVEFEWVLNNGYKKDIERFAKIKKLEVFDKFRYRKYIKNTIVKTLRCTGVCYNKEDAAKYFGIPEDIADKLVTFIWNDKDGCYGHIPYNDVLYNEKQPQYSGDQLEHLAYVIYGTHYYRDLKERIQRSKLRAWRKKTDSALPKELRVSYGFDQFIKTYIGQLWFKQYKYKHMLPPRYKVDGDSITINNTSDDKSDTEQSDTERSDSESSVDDSDSECDSDIEVGVEKTTANNIDVSLPSKSYVSEEIINILKNRKPVRYSEIPCHFDRVCSINIRGKEHVIPSTLSDELCEFLYKNGTKSKVGVGSETVLDRSIRRSKEYTTVVWGNDFMEYVTESVTRHIEGNGDELVKITPYKLIIYQADDFFKKHVDNVHTPGQNMTCVVELVSDYEGKGLEIDGKFFNFKEKHNKLIVFDHDNPHRVHKIEDGYKVSITFDLQVKTSNTSAVSVDKTIEKLKSLGVKKFGFFANHKYWGEQTIKGYDAAMCKAFKPHVKLLQKISVVQSNFGWIRYELWNVIGDTGMYNEVDDNYGNEFDYEGAYYDSDEEFKSTIAKNPKIEDLKEWSPDTSFNGQCFHDDYKLGNVFVLASEAVERLIYKGKEDMYTGNQGFDGEIYDSEFILMELS